MSGGDRKVGPQLTVDRCLLSQGDGAALSLADDARGKKLVAGYRGLSKDVIRLGTLAVINRMREEGQEGANTDETTGSAVATLDAGERREEGLSSDCLLR